MTSHRAARPRTRFRPRVVGIVAALTAVTVIGAPAAYAGWYAAVHTSGTVSAARLAVEVTGAPSTVMTNEGAHFYSTVTVANTTAGPSTRAATTTVRFASTGGDSTLADALLYSWPAPSASQCTASHGIGTGAKLAQWKAGATHTATLVPGQSQVYCLATLRGATASSESGSRSMTTAATATASVGSFQATATAPGVISTRAIYPHVQPDNAYYRLRPAGQSLCLDVTGGVDALPGAVLGTYACNSGTAAATGNQWFSLRNLQGSSANGTISTPQPAGTSLQVVGSGVRAERAAPTLTSQQWTFQRAATGTYQLVSVESGLCLTAAASAGPVVMLPCDDRATQRFTLAPVGVTPPAGFDLQVDEGAGSADEQGVDPSAPDVVPDGVPGSDEDPEPDPRTPDAPTADVGEAPAPTAGPGGDPDPASVRTEVLGGHPVDVPARPAGRAEGGPAHG